ncbi:MAG: A24 family peptidase [Nanoarchaeota archaeon]|nr:A24 family peptidase [Nanoarchaeota archaeon]
MDILIVLVCFAALAVASIMDLITREVADWLNFSLIASGIGINLILSIYFLDKNYILNSVFGLIFSVAIGYLMFYTGQWGGGDSKMIMGLGALIGLSLSWDAMLLKFYANILFAGAFYGLFWVFVLAFVHWKKIIKEVAKIYRGKMFRIIRVALGSMIILFLVVILLTPVYIINSEMKIAFYVLLATLFMMQHMWAFVKAIEKSAMIKLTPIGLLTEGDWIVKDVVIDGKRICGPKDLGIEKQQIDELVKLKNEGKIKKILVKNGIPFIPSFLLAFIYTIIFKNIFLISRLLL